MNLSWENHQQLIGDQASLDYALSCSNRINNNHNNNDLNSILTRTSHLTQVFCFSELIFNKNEFF